MPIFGKTTALAIKEVGYNGDVLVNLFGNYATIQDFGSGYGGGISGEINQDGFGFGVFYEYRNLEENFITGFFDPFYELGRSARFEGMASLDQRNIASFGDISFSPSETKDSFDSIFSISGGLLVPIGGRFSIMGKYFYRDFFNLGENDLLEKVQNSALFFGVQVDFPED